MCFRTGFPVIQYYCFLSYAICSVNKAKNDALSKLRGCCATKNPMSLRYRIFNSPIGISVSAEIRLWRSMLAICLNRLFDSLHRIAFEYLQLFHRSPSSL